MNSGEPMIGSGRWFSAPGSLDMASFINRLQNAGRSFYQKFKKIIATTLIQRV
jgi:hypothetical protein